MKPIKDALRNNGEDKLSSKRIITFLLVITLIVVIIADTFFSVNITEFVYNGLVEVVIWAMAFVGSEKFVDAVTNVRLRKSSSKTIEKYDDI